MRTIFDGTGPMILPGVWFSLAEARELEACLRYSVSVTDDNEFRQELDAMLDELVAALGTQDRS